MNRELYHYIITKKHHAFRQAYSGPDAEHYIKRNIPVRIRMADRFVRLCEQEIPHILPKQKIVFLRTVRDLPDVFAVSDIPEGSTTHELGYVSNLCPDYADVIGKGLIAAKENCDESSSLVIDAVITLADKYRDAAEREGRYDIAETLRQVPRYKARSFREALQMLRILHWALWAEGEYHNTLGRFDLYMKPYFDSDIANGVLNMEEAYELICDFFLACNIDSDLYPGVQQGDNGQSLMLGGRTADGAEIFSELSRLCLRASGELKLIDPKINLRVDKNTPGEVFIEGSRLTAAGLGFPQYSNDDVVIPGLRALGYSDAHAADYTVAACWEFIVPNAGADIVNIGALSFAKVIDRAFHRSLRESKNMEAFQQSVASALREEVNSLTDSIQSLWFVPAPFMDILFGGTDISDGAVYNNFGLHGTGVACAADTLAAIEIYLYNEHFRTPEEYIAAVDDDFQNDTELLNVLRNEAPKLGQNRGLPEKWARWLLEEFSAALEGKRNCRGGIWRAGTGSAMYYLWHADEIGASPDGRRKGEPLGTNYSPSLFSKIDGPVSVIDSFVIPDLTKCINGGPLTLEFSQNMLNSENGVESLAALVQYFVSKGGHQLQLNAIQPDLLRDAQKHPEKYPHLIVRVWGWSAYFVELDTCYQNQVLSRQEYNI